MYKYTASYHELHAARRTRIAYTHLLCSNVGTFQLEQRLGSTVAIKQFPTPEQVVVSGYAEQSRCIEFSHSYSLEHLCRRLWGTISQQPWLENWYKAFTIILSTVPHSAFPVAKGFFVSPSSHYTIDIALSSRFPRVFHSRLSSQSRKTTRVLSCHTEPC